MTNTTQFPKSRKKTRRRRRARLNYRRVFGVAFVIAAIVFGIVWLNHCSDGQEAELAAEQRIVERAYSDAMKAAKAPEGSMERERCVLAIRAFESKLRLNGYVREADDYHNSAEAVLKGQGVIK